MSTPNQETPTPMTDAAIVEEITCTEGGDNECKVYPVVEHVEADFARTLERTAAELRAENERLRRAYIRPDDIRAQLEIAQADLSASRVCCERLRDQLVKCFHYLGEEIERLPLNESAIKGTQTLSKETAKVLDESPVTAASELAELANLRNEFIGNAQHWALTVQRLNPALWKEYHEKGTSEVGWRVLGLNCVAAAALELAELRADRELLDWTEQGGDAPRVTELFKVYWLNSHRTLREAIKAARSASAKEKP